MPSIGLVFIQAIQRRFTTNVFAFHNTWQQETGPVCKSDIANSAVLKAPHHGQECGFHEKAVKLIDPVLIVFSNSEDQDRENGVESLYTKAAPDALILKTWEQGTILVDVPFDSNEKITYYTAK